MGRPGACRGWLFRNQDLPPQEEERHGSILSPLASTRTNISAPCAELGWGLDDFLSSGLCAGGRGGPSAPLVGADLTQQWCNSGD